MPVIILGSGRCGTSMVAGLLNICGLYVGTSDDMSFGDKNNPKGYWEHQGLCGINDRLLEHYEGSALVKPKLHSGWENDEWLAPLEEEARGHMQRLADSGQEWGWKDPKAGWTLAFWKKLVPGLKSVVCYRNPVDVVKSYDKFFPEQGVLLYEVGGTQGYWLWHQVNTGIIEGTEPDERVFTQYESYFPNYEQPIAELVAFLGLPKVEKGSAVDRQLAVFHEPTLNHNRTSLEKTFADRSVPQEVKRLYFEMISGNTFQKQIELGGSPVLERRVHSSLPAVDYAKVARIEKMNLELIARNRQLEEILASTTHRLASAVCSLLIGKDRLFNRTKSGNPLEIRSDVSAGKTPTLPRKT